MGRDVRGGVGIDVGEMVVIGERARVGLRENGHLFVVEHHVVA